MRKCLTGWLAAALMLLASSLLPAADAAQVRAMDLPSLEAHVASSPDDTDARYALARAYAQAGRFTEADAEYDRLLDRNANDVDWLLGKAQALLARERPREAIPLLQRARSVAPAYEDLWRSEAAALEAAGDTRAALELLDAAATQFPQSPWPAARRANLREARLLQAGTRLSTSAAYENLSGSGSSWRSLAIVLDGLVAARTRAAGGLAIEERYGKRDEQLAIGVAHRLSGIWAMELGGELTPDAELLAKRAVRLETSRPLGRAASGGLRYRHSTYDTVTVSALSAYAEYGLRAYRFGYTLTATKPTDIDATLGHALRFARDYGTGSSVSLLFARGDEAETVAPGQVLVTLATSVVLYGVHWRSAAWGLSWSCGWTEQGELYERLGARLGLEHRF